MRITISLPHLVHIVLVVHRVCLVLRVSVSRLRGATYPKRNRKPLVRLHQGFLRANKDTTIVLPTDIIA